MKIYQIDSSARKEGSTSRALAKKLLKLAKEKTGKKLVFQEPISPLGEKLLKSIEKWS